MTKVLFLFAAAALSLGACSTSNQLAKQKVLSDDVYYSEIKAQEQSDLVKTTSKASARYESDEDIYDAGPIYSNRRNQYYLTPRYYVSPYNRFDPWYDYGYGYGYGYGYYNRYSPGISVYIGSNPWLYNNIYTYNYGYPYYNNNVYGGLYSYNTYYPGYNYGAYQGLGTVNDPNYRARPGLRGSENIAGSIPGFSTIRTDGQGRVMTSPSRGEIYERQNTGNSTTSSTPARTSSTNTRPARTQTTDNQQPQPQRYTPPPAQQSEPRQSAPAPSSSGGGGGGGGGSDDRARPSRVN